jgi:hypothetical protein
MKYYLVHSNYDLVSYAVKVVYDEYYIIEENTLHYLKRLGIVLTVIDLVDEKDIGSYNEKDDLIKGRWYPDNFTIFHLPKVKLVSVSKKAYVFKYREYKILMSKQLCPLKPEDSLDSHE